tara:strand:- start:85 stop:723 length:639 start_codon:yes stop_codon:yes gene_type:complete
MKINKSTLLPIIKICGLTSLEQALKCSELGADWLGLNCWRRSSRFISKEKVTQIVAGLPKSVTTVGVFVNEPIHSLEEIMLETGMDIAQLHGDESPESCKKIAIPWFKAFRVSPEFELKSINDYGCKTFLLDSYSKTHYGGSGQKVDFKVASAASGSGKLILAGGLDPNNVTAAVKIVRPWGVDVCSGVEKEPGNKDLFKVKKFINNVRNIS